MATNNMFSLDGVMKAGTDMMGVASSSFQRAMKVQEVTSTKDENQPAFALNELVQACNKDGEEARTIAQALLKKVASTNPLVRWKALKAIRYICQNCPSTQFKKACGGPNASVIRESTTWTGTPHPRLGNSLNMRVRDTAKETLEEVFKASAPPTSFMGNGSTGSGVGSSGTGGGGSGLRSRIQGYGSTTGGKIQGGVGSALTGFSASGASKYVGFGSDDVNNGTGHWSKISASQTLSNGASSSNYGTPAGSLSSLNGAASSEAAAAANTAAARAAIGDEASVVTVLCKGSGGGVNPRATPEATRLFLSQASQLDAEVIALELTHKLFSATWQERVRALDGMHAVIESVVARGGGHPLEATVESLSAVTDAFKGVTGHENAAVRAAAARVLRGLKVDDQGGGAAAATQSGGAVGGVGVSAVPVDLLGGFDDSGAAGDAPRTAQQDAFGGDVSTAAQGGLGGVEDLMGDLTLLSTAPQPTPNGATNGNVATGAPDMFAGLKVASGSSAPAPVAPQQINAMPQAPAAAPAAPAAGANAVDLLDFRAPAAPQTAGATGLDDLISEWSSVPAAAPPAASVPAASAVQVDNMSAGMAAPAATPATAPLYAPQAGMQPMHAPQGLSMPPSMHGQQQHASSAFPGAGMQQQHQPQQGMGMPAAGSLSQGMGSQRLGAGAPGGMRATQQAFMHTSGELSRANNRDAFDFVNDAIRK